MKNYYWFFLISAIPLFFINCTKSMEPVISLSSSSNIAENTQVDITIEMLGGIKDSIGAIDSLLVSETDVLIIETLQIERNEKLERLTGLTSIFKTTQDSLLVAAEAKVVMQEENGGTFREINIAKKDVTEINEQLLLLQEITDSLGMGQALNSSSSLVIGSANSSSVESVGVGVSSLDTIVTVSSSSFLSSIGSSIAESSIAMSSSLISSSEVILSSRGTNTPPVFVAGEPAEYVVFVTTDVVIDMRGTDADGDLLTGSIKAGSESKYGSMVFSDSTATYTPLPAFAGKESFVVLLNDGYGGTAEKIINITLNSSDAAAANALQFDGTDDYVQAVPFQLSVSNGLTFECWVQWTGLSSNGKLFELSNGTAGEKVYLSRNGSTDELKVKFSKGAVASTMTSGGGFISTGKWTHVAVTMAANGETKIYKNGLLFKTETLTPPTDMLVRTSHTIGSGADGGNLHMGLLDDLRIWSVEKTGQEISDNMYAAFDATQVGLVAYYPFQESAPYISLADIIGGYTGLLTNMDGSEWKASFGVPHTLSISAAANGEVDATGTYSYVPTQQIAVVATPTSGYLFDKWVVAAGDATLADESSSSTTIDMGSENAVVQATFYQFVEHIKKVEFEQSWNSQPAKAGMSVGTAGSDQYIGGIQVGNHLEYSTIHLKKGNYSVKIRMATWDTWNRNFEYLLDGTKVGEYNEPGSGGTDYTNFTTEDGGTITVSSESDYLLRVNFPGGGVNLDWIQFTRTP